MKIFKNRKLRIDILSAFSILISLTVASEIIYSTNANKALILNFEKEYYSKIVSKTAVSWLDAYFTQLETVLNVLSKNFTDEQTNKFYKYDKLFFESLKSLPYTASFYICLKDGSYFQARTLEGTTTFQNQQKGKLPSYAKYAIKTIQNDKSSGHPKENWQYLDENFNPVVDEVLNTPSYNPTKRDWYVKAELQKERVWSDAYLFKTTKVAGITLSMPLGYSSDSTATGIIALDFMLSNFKGLLEKVKPSENAKNYLINEKNEILSASCDMKTFHLTNKTEDVDFVKAMESNDPVLDEAVKNLVKDESNHATFKVDNVSYVASIQKLKKLPISLLSISPQDDFTSNFAKVQHNMILISIFVFLISFGVIFWLSRRLSDPITKLCNSAKAIGNMDLENYPEPPTSKILEIQELSNAMNSMKLSVATFAKYAPKDLVRKLVKQGETPDLGGRTKEVTMLFSDIEKFSTVSEKLPAEYLILHLSEYFDEMTKEIMRHNGVIDKYIGDSVMAIWGAPNPDENQVINACYAALGCQEVLENLKQKWAPLGKPPLPTRIGLHTGQAIVGNIGSQDRMNFTAIGDSVNIASRLEGANKYYGTKILASESVESVAKGRILFRVIDKIAVKGRASGLIVYEPLCAMKDADNDRYYKLIELCAKSKETFELYQNQNFEEAIKHYEELLKLFPEVSMSIIPMIEKCKNFIENPPLDWDGVSHLTGK